MIPNVSFFALIVVAVIVGLHNPVVGHSVNDWCSKVEILADDCVIEVQLDLVQSFFRLLVFWIRFDKELYYDGTLIDSNDLDL